MNIAELADAIQNLAETLDQEQAEENYQGPQAMTLGKLSANLSAQASTLRTLVVAQSLVESKDAITAVASGTAAAKAAAANLKAAGTAIQIAGMVLSLAAAVISEDPVAVVSAAKTLVAAAGTLLSPVGKA